MTPNEFTASAVPLLMILVALGGGAAILLLGQLSEKAARVLFLATALGPAALSILLLRDLIAGMVPAIHFAGVLTPAGLSFRVDHLSLFMVLLFALYGLLLFIFVPAYDPGNTRRIRLWGGLSLTMGGALGVVMAGDLFTFFLFFEFMSLMFFILIANPQTEKSTNAATKFLFMTIIAGVALFLALAITYVQAGTVALGRGPLFAAGTLPACAAFAGFMIAFGIKSAVFPLHLWMPDAYTFGPVPAAALSSGMLLKTGVYGMIRIFHDIYGPGLIREQQWNLLLILVACVTILYGSLNALTQDDLLRRLAYSGIAQIGYVLLGISLLTESALIGSIYHIFAHAFMKGCLFLCAGAIINATGKRKVSELGGIGLQMPLTMFAFTVAGLTAVGVPPLNVFVTKWFLGQAALEMGRPLLLVLLLVSSMLNAAYYLPISIAAFLGQSARTQRRTGLRLRIKEASPTLLIPILMLAFGNFAFTAIAPQNWPLELARLAAHALMRVP